MEDPPTCFSRKCLSSMERLAAISSGACSIDLTRSGCSVTRNPTEETCPSMGVRPERAYNISGHPTLPAA